MQAAQATVGRLVKAVVVREAQQGKAARAGKGQAVQVGWMDKERAAPGAQPARMGRERKGARAARAGSNNRMRIECA